MERERDGVLMDAIHTGIIEDIMHMMIHMITPVIPGVQKGAILGVII